MRIKIIDGLRGIAVLGVLWVHIWMFSGNASYYVLNVDVAKLISFGGTGVDLFFVISGFCMYLLNQKNITKITIHSYISFIRKRWLRIAVAFYVAIIVYGLKSVDFNIRLFDIVEGLKYALFLRNYFSGNTYAPHFWSIATEWQFYLVFPIILYAINKFSFSKAIIIVVTLCISWRLYAVLDTNSSSGLIDYSLPSRLIEFTMGIIAANFYLFKQNKILTNNTLGLLIAFMVAFFGRLLMKDEIINHGTYIGIFTKVFNIPILSIGFALMILNLLNYKSLLSKLLESNVIQKLGKYSYSFYLWHWIIAESIYSLIKNKLFIHPFLVLNIAFVISIIILFPISKLSYWMFEAFYFKKEKKKIDPNIHDQLITV